MTTVADLMKYGLITCRPEAQPGEVARLLLTHRIHAAVVAEHGGPPLGIISDTDLLSGEWLAEDERSLQILRAMTARELMSTPVHTIEAGAPVEAAIARLRAKEVHRLVVLKNGQPVGVLSVSDVVAWLGRQGAERRTVGQVMSRALVVCRADTPLAAVARAMAERRSRSVVVVGARGEPLGVVTGADLLTAWPAADAGQTAGDLMHPPLTVGPESGLADAADIMLKHHVHRLVVVDPAGPPTMPLGLISTSDILAQMAAPGSAWQAA